VNLWLAILIAVGAAALGVVSILLVRRRAPEGGHFSDGDRAAGVFGVLATGFAVLLGLVVVLAFTSYDNTKSGAETEALLVTQQFETAQLLPPRVREPMGAQLVCYARYVVNVEWPRMESGTQGDRLNPWGVTMFRLLTTVNPQTPAAQAAYAKWLDQRSDREQARNDRLHGADGIIPTGLWIVLFLTASVIFVYMLFFADRGEPAIVQGVLMGTVVLVIAATLLVIGSLNNPYQSGFGGLKPTAMERTLRLLARERVLVRQFSPVPCTASGQPVT